MREHESITKREKGIRLARVKVSAMSIILAIGVCGARSLPHHRVLEESINADKDFGVSAASDDNTDALEKMRTFMIRDENARRTHWIVQLPEGVIRYQSPYWLRGVRYVSVKGVQESDGTQGTKLQNVRAIAPNSTDLIPLDLNPDYFYDVDGQVLDPVKGLDGKPGTINKATTMNFGDRIDGADAGSSRVQLLDKNKSGNYHAGDYVLIYGYNSTSIGWPPSMRYFEQAVINDVSADGSVSLVTEDQKPYSLRNSYDSSWPDIKCWIDIANSKGNEYTLGAPRILDLDRGDKFTLARQVDLSDLEFLPHPRFDPQAKDPIWHLTSLKGSLYTPGAHSVTINRCKIGGYYYPTISERTVVNDCSIENGEIDKEVGTLEINRTHIGRLENGPSVDNLIFNQCTFERPFMLNSKSVTFQDCTFLMGNYRSSYMKRKGDGSLAPGERSWEYFVRLSPSMPGSYTFLSPKIILGGGASPSSAVNFLSGSRPLKMTVGSVSSDLTSIEVDATDDELTRGVSIRNGALLKGIALGAKIYNSGPVLGKPLATVKGIRLNSANDRVVLILEPGALTISAGDLLAVSMIQSLKVTGPQILLPKEDGALGDSGSSEILQKNIAVERKTSEPARVVKT